MARFVMVVLATFLSTSPLPACFCVEHDLFCNQVPLLGDPDRAIFVGKVAEIYPAIQAKEYLELLGVVQEPGAKGPDLNRMRLGLLQMWRGVLSPAEAEKIASARRIGDLERPFAGMSWQAPRRIRLQVQERFQGAEDEIFELFSGLGGGDCGFPFKPGETYLVVAARDKTTGRWASGACSRTGLLEQSSADLAALRIWKSGKTVAPAVFGKVAEGTSPVPDLRLSLISDHQVKETSTDAFGRQVTSLQANSIRQQRI